VIVALVLLYFFIIPWLRLQLCLRLLQARISLGIDFDFDFDCGCMQLRDRCSTLRLRAAALPFMDGMPAVLAAMRSLEL
jgi:hypothetical protein